MTDWPNYKSEHERLLDSPPPSVPVESEPPLNRELDNLLFAWLYAHQDAMARKIPVEAVTAPYQAIHRYVESRAPRSPSLLPRNPELGKLLDAWERTAGLEPQYSDYSGETIEEFDRAHHSWEDRLTAERKLIEALFARSEQEVERLRNASPPAVSPDIDALAASDFRALVQRLMRANRHSLECGVTLDAMARCSCGLESTYHEILTAYSALRSELESLQATSLTPEEARQTLRMLNWFHLALTDVGEEAVAKLRAISGGSTKGEEGKEA